MQRQQHFQPSRLVSNTVAAERQQYKHWPVHSIQPQDGSQYSVRSVVSLSVNIACDVSTRRFGDCYESLSCTMQSKGNTPVPHSLESSGLPFCVSRHQQPKHPVMPSDSNWFASQNNVQGPVRMDRGMSLPAGWVGVPCAGQPWSDECELLQWLPAAPVPAPPQLIHSAAHHHNSEIQLPSSGVETPECV